MKCKFCGKSCKNDNSLRNHQRLCKLNVDRDSTPFQNAEFQKNKISGGGGTNQYIKADALNLPRPKITDTGRANLSIAHKGRKHSDETKRKLSEKLSINNKGGRCKWFEVSGQKVQGTWEKTIAEKLNELCVEWVKLKTNKDTLKYTIDSKEHSYTPDFYLPEYKLYLEIKGFWWGNDREKMKSVAKAHPNTKIIIIEKQEYIEIKNSSNKLLELINDWVSCGSIP